MCLSPIFIKNRFLDRKNISDFDFYKEKLNLQDDLIPLPCGKCEECLRDRSLQWTYRLALETQFYNEFCFVTLTYANTDGILSKRDYQLFIKRLRKKIYPKKLSYFLAGEYGSRKKRPHFHIVIFGYIPHDLEFFYELDNIKYYKSKELSDLWGNGFILVQRVDFKNLKYLTKYLQKSQNYNDKEVKPFVAMSKRPAIGLRALDKKWLNEDKIYLYGNYIKVPRYFLDKLEVDYPEEVKQLKNKRIDNARRFVLKQKDYQDKFQKNFDRFYKKRVDN